MNDLNDRIILLQKELDEFILNFAYSRTRHLIDINELTTKCDYFNNTARSFQQEYNLLKRKLGIENNLLQDKITQIIRSAFYASDLIYIHNSIYEDNI